eukprot:3424298-Pyramimonas_sp.AAC.1
MAAGLAPRLARWASEARDTLEARGRPRAALRGQLARERRRRPPRFLPALTLAPGHARGPDLGGPPL